MTLAAISVITAAVCVFCIIYAVRSRTDGKEQIRSGGDLEDAAAAAVKEIFGITPSCRILARRQDGTTAEIDVAAAVPQGVLCIECKYRNAAVNGGSESDMWKAVYADGRVFPMENPVRQNYYHVLALKRELGRHGNIRKDIPVYSVCLVYAEGGCTVDMLKGYKTTFLIERPEEIAGLKKLPEVLDEKEVSYINAVLMARTATEKGREDHIRSLS